MDSLYCDCIFNFVVFEHCSLWYIYVQEKYIKTSKLIPNIISSSSKSSRLVSVYHLFTMIISYFVVVLSSALAGNKKASQVRARPRCTNSSKAPISGNITVAAPAVDNSAILLGIAQTLERLSEHFNQMGGQSAPAVQSVEPRGHFSMHSPSCSAIPTRMKSSVVPCARRGAQGTASLRQHGSKRLPATSWDQVNLPLMRTQLMRWDYWGKGLMPPVCHFETGNEEGRKQVLVLSGDLNCMMLAGLFQPLAMQKTSLALICLESSRSIFWRAIGEKHFC